LLTKEVITLPEAMGFLTKTPESTVPFWIQLLLIELTVDALKIASLNTPDAISNSLGVVSGLLLGEFAIQVGWFVPQTILYSSICAIANYIPTNYELGYSIKFWRMSLIVFVELWKVWGFVINIVLFFIILSMNKTADGKSYLFPFSPFSKQGVKKFFIRTKSGKEKT
jgi:stage V sporulation protein AF